MPPVIDTHSHLVPAGYAAALRRLVNRGTIDGTQAAVLRPVLHPTGVVASPETLIAEMDAAGVDVSVIAPPPPGATIGERADRRELAATANDELLDVAGRWPGRFAVALALPFPHTQDTLAELTRVGSDPAARGVSLMTATEGWTPDDPALEPVYRQCAELGFPLVTHPAVEPPAPAWRDWMLPATLGAVISSSLGVARLAFSGLLDRLPDLDVLVPHLGGVLPYLVQRFADFGTGDAVHDLGHYLRERIWLDTCSYHPPAFRCAAETAGTGRLVLGTDHPFRGSLRRGVDDVRTCVPDPVAHAAVLGGTAARWFAPVP